MTVKRFGFGLQDDDLQASPVGPYVRWEDYDRLEKENRSLRRAVADGVFREMNGLKPVLQTGVSFEPITYQSGVTYYVCPHYDYRAMRTSPCDKGCPPP